MSTGYTLPSMSNIYIFLFLTFYCYSGLCRLAVGTALGFGVIDYAQKKSVFEKCTLGPPGETDSLAVLV